MMIQINEDFKFKIIKSIWKQRSEASQEYNIWSLNLPRFKFKLADD